MVAAIRSPMFGFKQTKLRWLRAAIALAMVTTAPAQSSNLNITRTNTGLRVSWTGRGTLQSATTLAGPWRDELEAGNPFSTPITNSQRFFRTISRWGTRASLLASNSEMAVAELSGKIYVMGGYPASRVTVDTVQVYDVTSNSWQLTTPLLLGVNHPMPAVANGKIYVIGGQTDTGSAFVNNVQQFDPATTNWTFRAPMPTARSAGVAAVVGDLIYVAGGRPPRGNDFAVYNATSNTWQTLLDLPTQRNHIAGCAIDGKIYIVGGRLAAGFTSAMTNILEVFDPDLGSWSPRAPMPTVRGGINGIAVEGCFFVFGGEGPGGVFEQMEMYIAGQNKWYQLEPLPVPVHGVTGSAYVNGFIHVPGGGTATGGSSGSGIHQVFWVGGICP